MEAGQYRICRSSFEERAKALIVHLVDSLILLAYCALLLIVSFSFRRRAGRNLESYFIAGRDLPWWVIGLSDTAAYTGGGQGFLMVFFLGGFSGLWLMAWVTWCIWMPLVAVLWARMWRRLGVVTTGEFIERRYGGRPARIFRNLFAVYACLAWGLSVMAYTSAWMAATLVPVIGWSSGQILAVFGGVTLVYLLFSGFFAVVYNDVIQFVLLMVGNTVFGWLLISRAGGFAPVWAAIEAKRGADFLSPWPIGATLTGTTVVALSLQGLFFAGSPFAGEGWTAQRYMAARNERHAVTGQIFNAALALVVRLVPFILLGLAAAAMYSPQTIEAPAELWGQLVRQHAPVGLFGLLVMGSVAGYMAALSSIVNWSASYLMNDLYRLSLRPQASEREYVLMGRIFSAVLLVGALVWGANIDAKLLERWVLFINSALVVFPLPLAWLKWFWWRTNVFGEIVGVLGAFPAGYVVWFGSDAAIPRGLREWAITALGWNLSGLVPAFGDLTVYPFWVGFSILFVMGWVAILTATLSTRPESEETLRAFYQAVRPIGFWGPIRSSLGVKEASRLQQSLIACFWGVLLCFSMVIGFFSMMSGGWVIVAIATGVAVVSGWFFVRGATGDQ